MGRAFEWPDILEVACLLEATTCVVSATIHLVFLLKNRISLARRYSLIQNVSTSFTLITFCIGMYVFFESLGSGSVGAG